jgi:predicted nicotinamide N-methyase
VIADRRAFIARGTRVERPPHCPEIALHLASDAVPLWQATEEELGAIGLPPPFWAFAWAGGQALARYILDRPETVAGKRVLDFAAGSGLVAIAAMRAGARSAIAADIDPFAIEAIAINAQLNAVAVDAVAEDLIGRLDLEVDLVLIGDCAYERDLAERVFGWIAALEGGGVAVLVGDPGRTYLPRDRLESLAQYRVPVTRALEDAEVKETRVWRLRQAA